jgi:hypothetical protein
MQAVAVLAACSVDRSRWRPTVEYKKAGVRPLSSVRAALRHLTRDGRQALISDSCQRCGLARADRTSAERRASDCVLTDSGGVRM